MDLTRRTRDSGINRRSKTQQPERSQHGRCQSGDRPLSPHLSIYRPQLTSITSILTRITGNALLLAALLIVWWFLAAATSPEYFALADAVITSWFGGPGDVPVALGAVVSHAGRDPAPDLDNAKMLELDAATKMGWAVIVGSVLLTLFTVVVI